MSTKRDNESLCKRLLASCVKLLRCMEITEACGCDNTCFQLISASLVPNINRRCPAATLRKLCERGATRRQIARPALVTYRHSRRLLITALVVIHNVPINHQPQPADNNNIRVYLYVYTVVIHTLLVVDGVTDQRFVGNCTENDSMNFPIIIL